MKTLLLQFHQINVVLTLFLFAIVTPVVAQETKQTELHTNPANSSAEIDPTDFSLQEYWQDQTEANLRWILLRKRSHAGQGEKNNSIFVFADRGVWSEGVQRIVFQLENAGFHCQVLNNYGFRNLGSYQQTPKTIIVPGGNAFLQYHSLGDKARKQICSSVSSGGSYVGICAGAYLASKKIIWQNKSYDYGLGLFDGTSEGEISTIAPWPKSTFTRIKKGDPSCSEFSSQLPPAAYYQGGPFFKGISEDQIIARYRNDQAAVITGKYKHGQFLLMGPHFEVPLNFRSQKKIKTHTTFSSIFSVWSSRETKSAQVSITSKNRLSRTFRKVECKRPPGKRTKETEASRLEVEKNLRLAIVGEKAVAKSDKHIVGIYADYGTKHQDVLNLYRRLVAKGSRVCFLFSINGKLSSDSSFSEIYFPKLDLKRTSNTLTNSLVNQISKKCPIEKWRFLGQDQNRKAILDSLIGSTKTEGKVD